MANVIRYTVDAYVSNLRILLLFSLSFVIAILIPVFAAFPTYNDMGGIFVRTASEMANLNVLNFSVIVASVFFSLIFLSFAIVAINIITKHERVHIRIKKEVFDGLEKYTTRVFVVLLLFTVLISLLDIAFYALNAPAFVYYVAVLLLTPFFFYAPSSIVIDDFRVRRAMGMSLKFFIKRFDYFLLWVFIAAASLAIFDGLFTLASPTVVSSFAMLIFNAVLVLPFLVLLQSQMYLKRFAMLKR